jgi:CBS domain-containing protein
VRNKFAAVRIDDNLTRVAELLSYSNVHRVPVLNTETGRVIDVISQSNIVAFIAANVGYHAHATRCPD